MSVAVNIVDNPILCESQKVRTFITYSSDSRKVAKNIYRCMKKNGMRAAYDFKNAKVRLDRNAFIYNSFLEVDYVLVLISPGYAREVSDDGTAVPVAGDDGRNTTLFLYSLMMTEYVNNGSKNKRFIPVLAPDVDRKLIPIWLQNTIAYSWPHDYVSLLEFLSKSTRS